MAVVPLEPAIMSRYVLFSIDFLGGDWVATDVERVAQLTYMGCKDGAVQTLVPYLRYIFIACVTFFVLGRPLQHFSPRLPQIPPIAHLTGERIPSATVLVSGRRAGGARHDALPRHVRAWISEPLGYNRAKTLPEVLGFRIWAARVRGGFRVYP